MLQKPSGKNLESAWTCTAELLLEKSRKHRVKSNPISQKKNILVIFLKIKHCFVEISKKIYRYV